MSDDLGQALFYLDKAVELCEHEAALVARSRCHYKFGHYDKSIADAQLALKNNGDSVSARGCLGTYYIMFYKLQDISL